MSFLQKENEDDQGTSEGVSTHQLVYQTVVRFNQGWYYSRVQRRLVFLDPMTDVEDPILRKDAVHRLVTCVLFKLIIAVKSGSICNTFRAALILVELPASSLSASRTLLEKSCSNPGQLPDQDLDIQ